MATLVNWGVGFSIGSTFDFRGNYPLVKIGELLMRNRRSIIVLDDVQYRRVTIRINNKGVSLRDEVMGKSIGTKRQFVVSAGQFIMSKIDARNGAMGIVPEYLEGAVTTQDFLSYNIDVERMNPHYFVLLTTTLQFVAFFQTLSSGTTNRQRLSENLFLEIPIPLPPLAEQERLVEEYEGKMQEAIKLEESVKLLEKAIEVYLMEQLGIDIKYRLRDGKGLQFIQFKELSRWSLEFLSGSIPLIVKDKIYPTVSLKTISIGKSGGTPSKSNLEYWKGNIPWVSPKDMKVERIEKTEDYISINAINNSSAPLIDENSILFVLRSGILRHTVPVAINTIPLSINQDLRAFKIISPDVIPEYLLFYFQVMQKDLLTLVKTSTTVESIDSERLENLQIPIPPLFIQHQMVEKISELRNKIDILVRQAIANRITAPQTFEQSIFH